MPQLAYQLSTPVGGNNINPIEPIENTYMYGDRYFTILIIIRNAVASISGLEYIPDNSAKIRILEQVIQKLFNEHPQIARVVINTLEGFYKFMETMILDHDFHPSHVHTVTEGIGNYAAMIHLSRSNELDAVA